MHEVSDVHDSPESLAELPEGLGVGWIDQVVPSQRSANVKESSPLSLSSPMAMQDVFDVHDTRASLLWIAPARWGAARVDQSDPDQPSANMSSQPLTLQQDKPTVMQVVLDEQDTPLSQLASSGGVGLG